jgi:hypothetical protein
LNRTPLTTQTKSSTLPTPQCAAVHLRGQDRLRVTQWSKHMQKLKGNASIEMAVAFEPGSPASEPCGSSAANTFLGRLDLEALRLQDYTEVGAASGRSRKAKARGAAVTAEILEPGGKNKSRHRRLVPPPQASDWPFPWEPVDLFWAKRALKFGNAAVLARYLRETKADQSLLSSLERMLNPAAAANETLRLKLCYRRRGRPVGKPPDPRTLNLAELADLLDPSTESQQWQLKFVGPKGSPGNPTQYWQEYSTYMKVCFALLRERKVELAVESVHRETGLSRATIYRAWKAFRPA